MNLENRLSKSRYVKGLRCARALYLSVHRYDLATPPTPAQQARFDVGHEVGHIAHSRFPGGVLVAEDHLHHAEAVATTQRLLAEDVPAIFEAAFTHDNVKVRVDVLSKLPDGGYELVEVKSTTKYRDDKHLPDAAVQLYVLRGAGVDVRRVSLMHLNREYVYPGGPYDPYQLLASTDITKPAEEFGTRVPQDVARFMGILSQAEPPAAAPDVNCAKPYECEFADWCLGEQPKIDLNEPVRTEAAVLRRLDELVYPLHFVDFETVMPALPIFPGTRSFDVQRVQWSLHTLHEDGRLEHAEYLLDGCDEPPCERFMTTLLDTIGTEGTFIHYSPYERTQLVDIAVRCPALRQRLVDRIPGFYDTLVHKLYNVEGHSNGLRQPGGTGLHDFDLGMRVVRDGCFHPVFGSDRGYSIKPAIQVLAPELPPYKSLAVGDGDMAMAATAEMLHPDTPSERVSQIRADLLAYCEQDTLAMVEIYRTLRARLDMADAG